jgi:hypothetical protein
MNAEQILEKHFLKEMINKDFNSFKKTHPTLLKCILGAINEALSQDGSSTKKEQLFCNMCKSQNLEDCGGGFEFACNDCGHFPIFIEKTIM